MDAADLVKISSKAVARSPFSPEYSPRDIATGVVADEGVDVAMCTKMSLCQVQSNAPNDWTVSIHSLVR